MAIGGYLLVAIGCSFIRVIGGYFIGVY